MTEDRQKPDVLLRIRCGQPGSAIWPRLFGVNGLCAGGSLDGKLAGDRFSIETAAGDVFAGTVAAHEPGSGLSLVIENMHGSTLRITTEDIVDGTDSATDEDSATGEDSATDEDNAAGEDRTRLAFALFVVGLHHDEVESFRARWRLQLSDLFGGTLDADVGWLS